MIKEVITLVTTLAKLGAAVIVTALICGVFVGFTVKAFKVGMEIFL
jgi:hypothetical protein